MKQLILTFLAGLTTGAVALGGLGYIQINSLSQNNQKLKTRLNKEKADKLKFKTEWTQLNQDFLKLKAQHAKHFDQKFGDLVQAKKMARWEALYELGLKAYQEKDIPQAYYAFSEVFQNQPQYKEVQKYFEMVKQAQGKQQAQEFKTQLKKTYLKAFDQQAKGQFAQAQANFEKVLKMSPRYKDAQKRLNAVSKQVGLIQRKRTIQQHNAWVKGTYKVAFNHQANGRYKQAFKAYQDLYKSAPKYKDVRKRYHQVKAKLKGIGALPTPPPAQPPSYPNYRPPVQKTLNCYQKGVELGQCMTMGMKGPNCQDLSKMSTSAPECQNNAEFKRGLKSVIKSGSNQMMKGFKF